MKTQLFLGSLFLLPFYCLSQAAVDKAASRVDSVSRYATTANATAANITTTAATIKNTASTLAELPGIFGIKKKAKSAQPIKEAGDNALHLFFFFTETDALPIRIVFSHVYQ